MNGLTNEQKQQQEAAAFGLPQRPLSLDVSSMTHEQIEALRGVLFQHDAQNAALAREFDLNKPPTPPYRYQEFPRLLYRDGKTHVAGNQVHLEELLEDGWRIEPQAVEVNLGGELTPAMMAEVKAIDAEARKPSPSQMEKELEALRAENEALKARRVTPVRT